MVMEPYVQEAAAENTLNQDGVSLSRWQSESSKLDESEDDSSTGLECNICLDFVQDPVVTFCGHLYCWPCIYKWIHFRSAPSEVSEEEQQQQQPPQCPVCKAEVSRETLIPLYGRGLTTPRSDGKAPQLGIVIPQRPPSPRCGGHLHTIASPTSGSRTTPILHPRSHASPTMSLGGTSATLVRPRMGMLDMVFATTFCFSERALYSYPNTYHQEGRISPRRRRYLMQAEESLNRVWFFLCCSVILCLLLF